MILSAEQKFNPGWNVNAQTFLHSQYLPGQESRRKERKCSYVSEGPCTARGAHMCSISSTTRSAGVTLPRRNVEKNDPEFANSLIYDIQSTSTVVAGSV